MFEKLKEVFGGSQEEITSDVEERVEAAPVEEVEAASLCFQHFFQVFYNFRIVLWISLEKSPWIR